MPDLLLIVASGTAVFLVLGTLISLMAMKYQKRRLAHLREVKSLAEAYQKEILKAQLEMQEQTFLSISQEIHDNVGQVLSLVRLNVSTLATLGNPVSEQKIRDSKALLDQAIEDLRNLSKRLNSRYITQQSLSDLLRFQLDLIQKTGVMDTSFKLKGSEVEVVPEKKLIILRIAQEALNNILKHAEANSIAAELFYGNGKMSLSLVDDGKGFPISVHSPAGHQAQGTGIQNMTYRATLIGANLSIRPNLGGGTYVSLELPTN